MKWKALLLTLFVFLILKYLAFSFMLLNFDPLQWEKWDRVYFIFTYVTFSFIIYIFTTNDPKDKKQ